MPTTIIEQQASPPSSAVDTMTATMDKVVTESPKIYSNAKTINGDDHAVIEDAIGTDSPTVSCSTMHSSVAMDDVDHHSHNDEEANNNNNGDENNNSNVVDDDDENLTPIPTRMGRTIIVSNSLNEQHKQQRSDDEMNQSHDYMDDMEQERQWLIEQALETLSKLAAMESSDYQERLVENSLPRIVLLEEDIVSSRNGTPRTSPRSTPNRRPHRRRLIRPTSRQKLDAESNGSHINDSSSEHVQVQQQQPPTSSDKVDLQLPNYSSSAPSLASSTQSRDVVSKLSQSIHRFHSLLVNLTRENDIQTCELVDLQSELDAERAKSAKLQTAVKKLHKKNVKLTDKLARNKSLGRQLVERVTKQKQQQDQEQVDSKFWKMACQVSHHEQALLKRQQQQQQQLSNGESVSGIESGCSSPMSHRDRTASDMSGAYLDGLQDFVTCEGRSKSIDSTSDVGDLSIESHQSLVTDDGIATVKIHRERTMTWPNVLRPSKSQDESDNKQDTVNKSIDAIEAKKGLSNSSSGVTKKKNNPFAAFLAPMKQKSNPYTLTFMKPCAMQVVAIPVPAKTSAEDAPYETQAAAQQVAYAICGFDGFDDHMNVKPTLGARLLRINGTPVDDEAKNWNSVEAIESAIVTCHRSISLTFRNDHWNKAQKEKLQAAIQEHSQAKKVQARPAASSGTGDAADVTAAAVTRRRANSNDLVTMLGIGGGGGRSDHANSSTPFANGGGGANGAQKNILGFLNFNHHGGDSGGVGEKNRRQDDQPEATPSEASAASTGKPLPQGTFDAGSETKTVLESSRSVTPLFAEENAESSLVAADLTQDVSGTSAQLLDDAVVCVEEPSTPTAAGTTALVSDTDVAVGGESSRGTSVSKNDVKQEPVIISSETVKSSMPTAPRNGVNRAHSPPPPAEKFMKNMGKLFSFGN